MADFTGSDSALHRRADSQSRRRAQADQTDASATRESGGVGRARAWQNGYLTADTPSSADLVSGELPPFRNNVITAHCPLVDCEQKPPTSRNGVVESKTLALRD